MQTCKTCDGNTASSNASFYPILPLCTTSPSWAKTAVRYLHYRTAVTQKGDLSPDQFFIWCTTKNFSHCVDVEQRYSQYICSGFHTQADKIALFKTSYPLVQKKNVLAILFIPCKMCSKFECPSPNTEWKFTKRRRTA